MQSTALDWQPQRNRPQRLALAMAVPTDELSDEPRHQLAVGTPVEAAMLQSQRFELIAGTEQQLRMVGQLGYKGQQACQMLLACRISSHILTGRP